MSRIKIDHEWYRAVAPIQRDADDNSALCDGCAFYEGSCPAHAPTLDEDNKTLLCIDKEEANIAGYERTKDVIFIADTDEAFAEYVSSRMSCGK